MSSIFKISKTNNIFNNYDRLLRIKITEIFNNSLDDSIDYSIDELFFSSINNNKRSVFNLTVSYGVGVMYVNGMCIRNYMVIEEPFDRNSYKNNKKTIKEISVGVT